MISDIEVGQVLWLRIRFNNSGTISVVVHPYLVVGVNDDLNVVEIAQLDSLKGKEWKAFKWGNKPILSTDPSETVIDKDSYVQMDNTFKIENFKGLEQFRRKTDKLSNDRLKSVLTAYRSYHDSHEIDEDKNVYMDKAEILQLNT